MSNTPKAVILIVDDTPANLRLLAGMLTQQNYKARPTPRASANWLLAELATHKNKILFIMKIFS